MVVSHGGLSCCFHTMAKQVSHSGPQWPTVAANPILKKTGEWGKAVGGAVSLHVGKSPTAA